MHASFNGHGTSSEIRETITLTQEQWSEVRVAIRLAADNTRDPQRKATRLALYETLIAAGAEETVNREMGPPRSVAPQGWSHAQGETDAPHAPYFCFKCQEQHGENERCPSVLSDMGDNDSRREG